MVEQQKIIYWTLAILSIILILGPVIYLLGWRATEANNSKPFYMALAIFAGVLLHGILMAIDYFTKEKYSDFDGTEFDGIGAIQTKNNPLENKIPNLSTQTATDLVDYTTIRTSLTDSLQPPPFAMGAQKATRIKSPPHGF